MYHLKFLLCLCLLLKRVKSSTEIDDLLEIFDSKLEDMEKRMDEKLTILAQTLNKTGKQVDKLFADFESRSIPENCGEVLNRGSKISGVYTVRPRGSVESFEVLCNMDTRGGGWTYVLNRFDGSQNFSLGWDAYKRGFGSLDQEFWLGLEHLHQLTHQVSNEVLIELVDWNNKQVYAFYDNFKIGSEVQGYAVQILGQYSGTAGDSFHNHTKMNFSTKDRDQDMWLEGSCANAYDGGWWYNRCHETLLTGTYFKRNGAQSRRIVWKEFHGYDYSLKEARMMIRPRQ